MSSGGEDETLAGIDKVSALTCYVKLAGANISQSPSNASSRLAGWSAIEDYMRRHDHNMMKVFVEDMDTLLVFVCGLHSFLLVGLSRSDCSPLGWVIFRRLDGFCSGIVPVAPGRQHRTFSAAPVQNFVTAG